MLLPFIVIISVISTFFLLQNKFDEGGSSKDMDLNEIYESYPINALNNQPYENWEQQNLLFGQYSYYKAPWRSYMDTWNASQYLNVQGINFNVSEKEATATAKVLASAGIRSARIEVPWHHMNYDNPTSMSEQNKKKLTTILTALKNNKIRPLILLNGNSGAPTPLIYNEIQLVASAQKGDRTIQVQNTSLIMPGYTGLRNDGKYHTAYPLITECNSDTGICQLSAPLNTDHQAGKLQLTTLKYQPIGGANTEETVEGWIHYIKEVSQYTKEVLGNNNFDLEVWNELSFGSHFLNLDNYYEPKIEKESIVYKGIDYGTNSYQAFLPITVDVIGKDPNFKGVRIINGYSNQRPWDSGKDLLNGQAGFSRHYYSGYEPLSEINSNNLRYPKNAPVNALGLMDGQRNPNNWNTAEPGTFYVPNLTADSPEKWFTGNIIENIVRDIQPAPSQWDGHYRYSHNGNGKHAEVWMTETNWYRQNYLTKLATESNVSITDPSLNQLEQFLATKALLRIYSFYSNKGIETVNIYAAKSNDHQFSVIAEEFFKALNNNNGELTPEIEKLAGPQLAAMKNVTNIMRQGESIESPRKLQVIDIKVPNPILQFKGDGTQAHPDVFNVQDLAVLPTQLSNNRFAIGYYVATQHFTKAYHYKYSVTDPRRYEMPDQYFEITLMNIKGNGSKISVYDPITNNNIPVSVTRRTSNTISIKMPAVDYPRYLMINENETGAQVLNPRINENILSFTSKTNGKAKITWGPYPNRTTGKWSAKYYNQNNKISETDTSKWEGLVEETITTSIDFEDNWNPTGSDNFSAVWDGKIKPKYSEVYYFNGPQHKMDMRVYINSELIYNSRGAGNGFDAPINQGSKKLEAGKEYDVKVLFTTNNRTSHPAKLYWWSASQPKEIVPPLPDGTREKIIDVKKDKTVTVRIPGGLNYKEGYKITIIDSNGIVNTFPQWDYDTRAVNWEKGS